MSDGKSSSMLQLGEATEAQLRQVLAGLESRLTIIARMLALREAHASLTDPKDDSETKKGSEPEKDLESDGEDEGGPSGLPDDFVDNLEKLTSAVHGCAKSKSMEELRHAIQLPVEELEKIESAIKAHFIDKATIELQLQGPLLDWQEGNTRAFSGGEMVCKHEAAALERQQLEAALRAQQGALKPVDPSRIDVSIDQPEDEETEAEMLAETATPAERLKKSGEEWQHGAAQDSKSKELAGKILKSCPKGEKCKPQCPEGDTCSNFV